MAVVWTNQDLKLKLLNVSERCESQSTLHWTLARFLEIMDSFASKCSQLVADCVCLPLTWGVQGGYLILKTVACRGQKQRGNELKTRSKALKGQRHCRTTDIWVTVNMTNINRQLLLMILVMLALHCEISKQLQVCLEVAILFSETQLKLVRNEINASAIQNAENVSGGDSNHCRSTSLTDFNFRLRTK